MKEFKIDLIVWKCIGFILDFLVYILFKIDLIVWKLEYFQDFGYDEFGLK